MRLKAFAGETYQGPKLNINEDIYDYDIINNLFMIFDGFGGSGIGDQCVLNLKENIKKNYLSFSSDPDATFPFFYSPRYLVEGNALINSMLYSHSFQLNENSSKEISARGGASGIMVAQVETLLTMASVGNCQAYLIRQGKIQSIFSPDNFEMLNLDSSQRHLATLPTSGFGLYPDLSYQIKEVRIKEMDTIVLLTDGIYARLDHSEILGIMINPKLDNKSKIREAMKLANTRGNLDNQTAFIMEY